MKRYITSILHIPSPPMVPISAFNVKTNEYTTTTTTTTTSVTNNESIIPIFYVTTPQNGVGVCVSCHNKMSEKMRYYY